jgi:predicted RNA-binding Zn ribbon-like protein
MIRLVSTKYLKRTNSVLFSDMPTIQGRKSSADTDPIAFLVRFANAELEQFREGDWLNLQDDLAAFADRTQLSGALNLTLMPTDEPRKALGPNVFFDGLQDSVRRLLRTVAESQSAIDLQGLSSAAPESVEVVITLDAESGRAPRIVLSGEYLDLLFVKAVWLLASDPAGSRLRLCPECEAAFLRIRKQLYCSRRCVNRANKRAWLDRGPGKASHRASSRRSYVKRARAHTGPNVKVSQRRRK